jgi:hypothetical protein
MIKRFLLLLLLAAGGWPARAFVLDTNPQGLPPHWNFNYPPPNPNNPQPVFVSTNCFNPWTRAVRYYLASDGFSATNTAAELNAIRDSFGQWMSIPGVTIKFEDAGLITRGTNFDINLAWPQGHEHIGEQQHGGSARSPGPDHLPALLHQRQ